MQTQTLNSIGHVCQILQRMYGPIQRAVKELGIEPAARINGIPHFDDRQVEQISEYLREKAAK